MTQWREGGREGVGGRLGREGQGGRRPGTARGWPGGREGKEEAWGGGSRFQGQAGAAQSRMPPSRDKLSVSPPSFPRKLGGDSFEQGQQRRKQLQRHHPRLHQQKRFWCETRSWEEIRTATTATKATTTESSSPPTPPTTTTKPNQKLSGDGTCIAEVSPNSFE